MPSLRIAGLFRGNVFHPTSDFMSPELNPLPHVDNNRRLRNIAQVSDEDCLYTMVRYVRGHICYVRVLVKHHDRELTPRNQAARLWKARRDLRNYVRAAQEMPPGPFRLLVRETG